MVKTNAKAIEAGRQRRLIAVQARVERWEKNVEPLLRTVAFSLRQRVTMAAEHVRNKVVVNISRPVTKYTGKVSGRIQVTNRSKRGEFPKADTTMLLKSIFKDVQEIAPNVIEGYVGMPLDYGAILETNPTLDRKFLTRTLFEEMGTVTKILTGPIR